MKYKNVLLSLFFYSYIFCAEENVSLPTGRIDLSLVLNSNEQKRFGLTGPAGESFVPLFDVNRNRDDQSWLGWMACSMAGLLGSSAKVSSSDEDFKSESEEPGFFYTSKQQEILDNPLFMACMTGNAQDVLAALACGAQINARNALGNTPLGVAVRYNRVDIIEILLLKGSAPSSIGYNNRFPLMLAIDNNSVEAVSLLLKYGALLSDAVMREMVLEYAVKRGSLAVVKTVLLYCDRGLFFGCGNLSELAVQRVVTACKHRKHEDESIIAKKVLSMINQFIAEPTLLGSALLHRQDENTETFLVVNESGDLEERSI